MVLSDFATLVNEENNDKYIDVVYAALNFYPSLDADLYITATATFNAVTRSIAEKENLVYADITEGLEYNKEYFTDNYHLTVKGTQQFADNYAKVLVPLIKLSFPH